MNTKNLLFELKNVNFEIQSKNILKDVSFQIKKGEYVGLIGPNGAGKTTLLKIILKIIKPSSGHIVISPSLKIGYVPQKNIQSGSFPISVKEILSTGLNHSSFQISQTQFERISKALHEVGLDESFLVQNFQKLSGGQQQRILLARSLVNDPDLILFDEPFNGVDKPTQTQIYALLKQLNLKGVTIFFVSHDIDSITENCQRILCLDQSLHQGCHPVLTDFKTKCSSEIFTSTSKEANPIHHHNHS